MMYSAVGIELHESVTASFEWRKEKDISKLHKASRMNVYTGISLHIMYLVNYNNEDLALSTFCLWLRQMYTRSKKDTTAI